MLDLKSFFRSIKTFVRPNQAENNKATIKNAEVLTQDWQAVETRKNDYSVCAVDGSFTTPSRHFGNSEFSLVCASAVLINYQKKSFANLYSSKIQSTALREKLSVQEWLSQAMTALELFMAQDSRLKDAGAVFFDTSFDYLCNNLSNNFYGPEMRDSLEKIFDSKTAIFYVSNPSLATLEKKFGRKFIKNSECPTRPVFIKLREETIPLNLLGQRKYSTFLMDNAEQFNRELALIEIVTTSAESEILSIIADQTQKGSGYPRCLALAHNYCTVSHKESLFFNSFISQKQTISSKQTQKDVGKSFT